MDLKGWYHTIELSPGVVTQGVYDHRLVVEHYGFPPSLKGMTVLDVGTAEGFFAFEFERRGADRVVAVDVPDLSAIDWLPRLRPSSRNAIVQERFQLAHTMRRSRVERVEASVYELTKERLGTFDLVFCGSLLLHVQNPWSALARLRDVTEGMLVLETLIDVRLDEIMPNEPVVRLGHREHERVLGESCTYWKFSTSALLELLEYVGFMAAIVHPLFYLPPGNVPAKSVHALTGRPPLWPDTFAMTAETRVP